MNKLHTASMSLAGQLSLSTGLRVWQTSCLYQQAYGSGRPTALINRPTGLAGQLPLPTGLRVWQASCPYQQAYGSGMPTALINRPIGLAGQLPLSTGLRGWQASCPYQQTYISHFPFNPFPSFSPSPFRPPCSKFSAKLRCSVGR